MDQTLAKFKIGASRARTITVTVIMSLLLLLVGLPLLAASVAIVLEPDSTLSLEEKAIASLLVLGTGALVCFYAVKTLREYTFRRASLTLTSDSLVINDPRGLNSPVRIPLSDVVACAVDKGSARTPSGMFPLTRSSGWANAYAPGALESDQGVFLEAGATRGSILPIGSEHVNLIIVFRQSYFFDVDTAVPGERHRLKVRTATQAIVLPARKPLAVAEQLQSRGVRVGLETVDVECWRPPYLEALVGKFDQARAVIMGWAPSPYMAMPTQMPVPMPMPMQPPAPIPAVAPPVHGFDPSAFRAQPRPAEFAQSDAKGLAPEAIAKRLRRAVLEYFALVGAMTLALVLFGLYLMFGPPQLLHGVLLVVLGGLMLWALVPSRRDSAAGDGMVELDNTRHPLLNRILHDAAARLGSELPDRTGVTFEIEAGVYDAAKDFVSRRSYEMRVGLPLLAVADQREFAALAAHELSHVEQKLASRRFAANAIERALIAAYMFSEHFLGFLVRPITNRLMQSVFATLREAEYQADARAAELYGADAVSSLLKKTLVADALLPSYWNNFAEPALNLGLRPPLMAGFRAFVEREGRAGWTDNLYLDELDRDFLMSDELSTHPAVAKRLANLRAAQPPLAPPVLDAPPPLLADDGAELELAVLSRLAPDRVGALRRCDWPTALDALARNRWNLEAARLPVAPGMTVTDLVELAKQYDRAAVSAVFANALLSAGATLGVDAPGDRPALTINGISIQPDETVDWLAGPTIDRNQWLAASAANGLQEIPLAPLAGPAAPVAASI